MTCEFAGYLGLSVLKLYFENNGDLPFVFCGRNLSKSWYIFILIIPSTFDIWDGITSAAMNLFWAAMACFSEGRSRFGWFLVGRAGFGWFWVVSGGFGSFRFLVITLSGVY